MNPNSPNRRLRPCQYCRKPIMQPRWSTAQSAICLACADVSVREAKQDQIDWRRWMRTRDVFPTKAVDTYAYRYLSGRTVVP